MHDNLGAIACSLHNVMGILENTSGTCCILQSGSGQGLAVVVGG